MTTNVCSEPSTSSTNPVVESVQHIDVVDGSSSTRINRFYLAKLAVELRTREQCVNFAIAQGLLLGEKQCRVHRVPLKILYNNNKNVGSFTCRKGTCRGKSSVSRATGTWFENVKITLPHVFYLMYCYSKRFSYDFVLSEDIFQDTGHCLSTSTITDWYNYCREVVVLCELTSLPYSYKIGGPGKIVQIDESQFSKGICNKDRHIDGHWVIGMIERGSTDLRLEVCPDNTPSADALVLLIKKHVHEGTIIRTDHWQAYNSLGEHGFVHEKVILSDPDNPSISPEGLKIINSQWKLVRSYYGHRGIYNHPNFSDLILEYQWRRRILVNKKDSFIELIKCVRQIYPVP